MKGGGKRRWLAAAFMFMKVEIDQFAQRVQALFFGESDRMLQFVAKHTKDELQKWYGSLPDDWFDNPNPFPDGTPRHAGVRTFMWPLTTKWKTAVESNGFSLIFDEKRKVEGETSTVWGLRLQQYGDTITPVEKKALTIPVTADARGVSARRFEQKTGHRLFVVKGKNKKPEHIGSLVWEDPGGDLHAAYVLRTRAEVKPLKERRGHDAIPSQEQLGKWAANSYLKFIKYSFLYG